MIWTNQEVGHWLSLDARQWAKQISDKRVCWELSQLLDESYGAGDKFPTETLEIAQRVLACQSERALHDTIDLALGLAMHIGTGC